MHPYLLLDEIINPGFTWASHTENGLNANINFGHVLLFKVATSLGLIWSYMLFLCERQHKIWWNFAIAQFSLRTSVGLLFCVSRFIWFGLLKDRNPTCNQKKVYVHPYVSWEDWPILCNLPKSDPFVRIGLVVRPLIVIPTYLLDNQLWCVKSSLILLLCTWMWSIL